MTDSAGVTESMEQVVQAWAHGWTASRGVPAPERCPEGWLIATRTTREHQRWVLPTPSVADLSVLLRTRPPVGTCVKLPGDRDEWLPRFGQGWVPESPQWLLTTRLQEPRRGEAEPPPGYHVEATVEATRAAVTIRTADGGLAASGIVGLAGRWAVPDQISTEPAHRRQGLGTVLMAVLTAHAVAAGADRGVLGATAQGRALYVRAGWTVRAGLVGAYFRPAAASGAGPG